MKTLIALAMLSTCLVTTAEQIVKQDTGGGVKQAWSKVGGGKMREAEIGVGIEGELKSEIRGSKGKPVFFDPGAGD